MPNWCANRVRVWGDNVQEMKEFKEFVSKEFNGTDKDGPWSRVQPFSFEAIRPMPEELHNVQSPVTIKTAEEIEEYKNKHGNSKFMLQTLPITQEYSDELDRKYGNNNWYDWSNENWGVKWDCSNVEITEEYADLELCYTFDTPWGPPNEIYHFLKAKFPDIGIQWFWDEPGCEQAGYLNNGD